MHVLEFESRVKMYGIVENRGFVSDKLLIKAF